MINGFVSLGNGHAVAYHRVLAILPYESVPSTRLVRTADEENKMLDFTGGNKRKTIIVLDNETVIVSAINSDTIVKRFNTSRAELLRMETEEHPSVADKGKGKRKKKFQEQTPPSTEEETDANKKEA